MLKPSHISLGLLDWAETSVSFIDLSIFTCLNTREGGTELKKENKTEKSKSTSDNNPPASGSNNSKGKGKKKAAPEPTQTIFQTNSVRTASCSPRNASDASTTIFVSSAVLIVTRWLNAPSLLGREQPPWLQLRLPPRRLMPRTPKPRIQLRQPSQKNRQQLFGL